VQPSVLKVKYYVYLVGQPGSWGCTGCIIGKLESNYLMEFLDRMQLTFEVIMNPYFTCQSLEDMVKQDMMDSTKKVIETHWIFFRDMRNHLEYYPNVAFLATSVFRKKVQELYNT
jgi:hypothetical protein